MGGEGRKLLTGQPRHLSTASKQISLSRVITSRACKAHLLGTAPVWTSSRARVPPWTATVFAGSITNVT